MPLSTPVRRTRLAAAGLALAGSLALTGCGEPRPADAQDGAAARPPGASPYVEPGANDGAPHYNENNAHRQPREMSPAHEKDAQREAERIEPVLKKLWKQGKWDPGSVRAALLGLGYAEGDGGLAVEAMRSRYQDGEYVVPEGAMVGLRVHRDACVTAFVQKSNYGVQANGPYLETGCMTPPVGH
ncbi:hypothetical protein STRCI_006257 [Streptomyces cinnabarinus]|uniref:Lipoprotein n=1 Tax=Streptomyces cinnabarinus TaxID=67287 RepID=A0ABY7KMC0_9ACTN|nr:hypothetical protein [Streptomyces cinnabarinus]WAZ24805.1 hypothetical protein STRCI_006257 [Streptomyces cinnabarinus]